MLSGTQEVWLWDVMVHGVTEWHNSSSAQYFGSGGMCNLWEMESWQGDAMEACLMWERKGFPCRLCFFPFCRVPAVQGCLLGPEPSPANNRQNICSLYTSLAFLIHMEILIVREDGCQSWQVLSQNSSRSCRNIKPHPAPLFKLFGEGAQAGRHHWGCTGRKGEMASAGEALCR